MLVCYSTIIALRFTWINLDYFYYSRWIMLFTGGYTMFCLQMNSTWYILYQFTMLTSKKSGKHVSLQLAVEIVRHDAPPCIADTSVNKSTTVTTLSNTGSTQQHTPPSGGVSVQATKNIKSGIGDNDNNNSNNDSPGLVATNNNTLGLANRGGLPSMSLPSLMRNNSSTSAYRKVLNDIAWFISEKLGFEIFMHHLGMCVFMCLRWFLCVCVCVCFMCCMCFILCCLFWLCEILYFPCVFFFFFCFLLCFFGYTFSNKNTECGHSSV